MKRVALILAFASGTSGCARELTNRQLVAYVAPVAMIVGVITVAAVAGGCKNGCDLSDHTTR
jgi:hypothetical protein